MIDLNGNDSQLDLDALSAALAQCAASWVPKIFPNGRLENDELRLANIAGDPPRKNGSCVIELAGERAGSYYDHTTGEGGAALATLKAGVGLNGPELFAKAEELITRYGNGAAAKANGDARKSTRKTDDNVREAQFALSRSVPPAGTLVEVYFTSRGLALPVSEDILFNPDLTYFVERRGIPAMVARVRYPDGTATGGIHRTYLRADGRGKADIPKPKMMLGPCDGGVVMLAPIGEGGVLGIGEGIETTAAGMQIFGVPGWAALSAGGMRKFGAWLMTHPRTIARLLIFADTGPAGESAAAELRATAAMVSILAEVHLPQGDDDFADDLAKGLSPQPAATVKRPIIRVVGGDLPAIIDEAEEALIAQDPLLYQRGDFIVRPAQAIIPIADDRKTVGVRLIQVRANHMIERLTHWVDFQRFDARSKKWVSIDCPPKIAATYLERVGAWRLRSLTGLTVCPTLRPDGSILDQPGWDELTGILYAPGRIKFPPIPVKPTIDDAIIALSKLKTLIADFPFVGEANHPNANRSVALSGILTATIRRSLISALLHAFSAPVAGSGKSKLVDVASMIASGHEAPVIAQGADEEELEKRLAAMLMAGDVTINIDNCEESLSSSFLCQCLTQQIVRVRVLGKSQVPTVASNAAFYATGNNLVIAGDLTRRSLRCQLDPECERPELRSFKSEDPALVLKREWTEYLVAALTVLRAFHVAGRPSKGTPLGSFETWWEWVRGALVWLGEPDPCDTIENIRAEDPKLRALSNLLQQWHRAMGTDPATVKQAIDKATDFVPQEGVSLNPTRREYMCPEFREALLEVAGKDGFINPERLGKFLLKQRLRIINGLYIDQGFAERTWRVLRR